MLSGITYSGSPASPMSDGVGDETTPPSENRPKLPKLPKPKPLIDPPPCCPRCTPGASWPRKYRSPQGRTSTQHSNHVRKLRRRIRRWMSRRGPAPEAQAQTRWTTLKPGVRKRTPSLETVIPRGDNVPAERAPSSRWDCTRHLPEMRYNHLTPHAHHPFPYFFISHVPTIIV